MVHQILKLSGTHPTIGYSHVAKSGNTLYIAGQVAKDANDNIIGKGDFQIQARQVYTNLRNIVEQAGGNLQNIVKMTTFLTHCSYVEMTRTVRAEFFREPFPPNTLIIVESLFIPDFMIEVEAIAELD